jgi:transglutaminase-like putative cysteine protease
MSARTEGSRWLRYRAWSWPRPLDADQRRQLAALRPRGAEPAADPAKTVQVPQRVRDLARQWCADLLSDRAVAGPTHDRQDLAIAQRISQRLKADYAYSLDFSDADPDRDGVEDFLFYMHHGHCEYFASAMTTMCRGLGVQARLATGFHVDQSNLGQGPELIVRSRDAHAWTEVYTPATDWVVVDATGSGFAATRERSLWSRLRDWWWHIKSLYHDDVIGYDALSHRQTALWLRSLTAAFWARLSAAAEAVKRGFFDLLLYGQVDRALVRFGMVLLVLAAGIEALLIVRGVRRRRAKSAGDDGASLHLEFFEALQALLRRRGLPTEPHQTYRQQARAASLRLDLPYHTLAGLVDLYYRARWGGVTPTPAELQTATETVRELEKAGR